MRHLLVTSGPGTPFERVTERTAAFEPVEGERIGA